MMKVGEISFQLERKPIKNLYIRITPSGGIKVSAPLNCPSSFIENFINNKHAWITKKLGQKRQTMSVRDKSICKQGSLVYFLGHSFYVNISRTNAKSQIYLKTPQIHFRINNSSSTEKLTAMLKLWYRHNMQTILPALIKKWEARVGVSASEYRIKSMKTRWGSCNVAAKRIWLNLDLIQMPIECLEYVLVHEMVHLYEASHNRRFYSLMDKFMPEWRRYKKLLEGSPITK